MEDNKNNIDTRKDINNLAMRAKGGDRGAKEELARIFYPIAANIAYTYSKKVFSGMEYIGQLPPSEDGSLPKLQLISLST